MRNFGEWRVHWHFWRYITVMHYTRLHDTDAACDLLDDLVRLHKQGEASCLRVVLRGVLVVQYTSRTARVAVYYEDTPHIVAYTK